MSEASGPSAGQLLRRARESAGLHIAALAVALKVPVRKLEALEADRFELLPDAVFVRALASSVCRTLKIDAAPVLERLPQTAAPRLSNDRDGINTPFRAPGDGPGPSWRDQLKKPVVLAVLALVVGAGVIFLVPPLQREGDVARNEPVMPPDPAPAPTALVNVEPAGVVNAQSAAGGSAAPAPSLASMPPDAARAAAAPIAASAKPVSMASSATVTATAMAPSPTPAASAAAPAVPASGLVVFRTSAESWVQVTDAKGVVTLRKLMTAGESAGATGMLPLTVTVGRVSATEVQVRGKPFNMSAVSRDDVARFEVK